MIAQLQGDVADGDCADAWRESAGVLNLAAWRPIRQAAVPQRRDRRWRRAAQLPVVTSMQPSSPLHQRRVFPDPKKMLRRYTQAAGR